MNIEQLTIDEIITGYKEKRFSVKEVVESYIHRIKKFDNKINSFITLCEDTAIKEAEEVDKKLNRGEKLGELAGVPVAIKDNICTRGVKTTCASKMLEDFIPPYDATVVKKLKDAGAIIIGKTNMDEFAMGSSTENSAFYNTKNPWDLKKVPGGSSGGSAAAMAAGFAAFTLGSDTGGSIRQPAAFCGTVGLKPTYGLVSRYGLIAFASSLDQIGPFSKTVKDCGRILKAIQGNDPLDSTSVQGEVYKDYIGEMDKDIKGLKIGIPKECLQDGLNEEIKKSLLNSIDALKKMGAEVEEFSLPIMDLGLSAYYIISSAEASSNLARYDGVRYGYRASEFKGIDELILKSRSEAFGKEVKRRIMLGTYVLSSGYYDAYYNKAMELRKKIMGKFNEVFSKYDIVLTPTSPILPFNIGEKISDPLEMYLSDIYTVNINIAGLPGISIPCGFSSDNLPIGIQLIGNHFEENKLLRVANNLERFLDVNKNFPQIKEAE